MRHLSILLITFTTTLLCCATDSQARYIDGMNQYEYVRSNPVRFVDPYGTSSIEITLDAGGSDPLRPWFEAPWEPRNRIAGEIEGQGQVLLETPGVECICEKNFECSTDCATNEDRIGFSIRCKVSLAARILIYRGKDKGLVGKGPNNVDILTPAGEQIYGHEQWHVRDYHTQLNQVMMTKWGGLNVPKCMDQKSDCDGKAKEITNTLEKELKLFKKARTLTGQKDGPDITHGGPNQPGRTDRKNPLGPVGPVR